MKLSSQEEFGLRCLVQLGRQGEGVSLTIADLARLEGISAPNVAKILRVLRQGGFVTSTRGQSGGYALARSPARINIGEAMAVLGGRLYDPSFCDKHAGIDKLCCNLSDCTVRSVWRLVQGAVDQVLGRLTLQHLLASEEAVTVPAQLGRVALPILPGGLS
jgi:Rrf2 family protein